MSYYTTEYGGHIRVAERSQSAWTAASVASVGTGSGGFNALGIDAQGAVHLVFHDAKTKSLNYAYRAPQVSAGVRWP